MIDKGSSSVADRSAWSMPDDVIYLNHGSFGPAPRAVQAVREEWSRRLNANPMDFFLRAMEPALDEAAARLGQLVGADARDLVFVENATVAMNVVAESLPLGPGDEVLLNDHEYGAVFRVWRRACDQVGAKIVSPTLGQRVVSRSPDRDTLTDRRSPEEEGDLRSEPRRGQETRAEQATRAELASFTTVADIIEPILAAITPRTKLIVVSHVTSPTGIVFPVAEICQAVRARGIPVCIDGPHAIAMREVHLRKIDCDFYCASLHKWLSAPFGSGFLFVRRRWQSKLKPHLVSWGRSLGGRPARWQDDLNWLGTRDPAPFLAVPAAIEFLERIGFDTFRQQTHELARYARQRLEETLGHVATIPDSSDWYGSMIAVPLVEGRGQESGDRSQEAGQQQRKSSPNVIHPLQQWLWDRHRIETLVTECHGRRYLRVSCHLYNSKSDIDALADALKVGTRVA
ncbi:MAG: aminotransferase class V-fold PLP-dependent enzyme [Planctomycetota bacterium]